LQYPQTERRVVDLYEYFLAILPFIYACMKMRRTTSRLLVGVLGYWGDGLLWKAMGSKWKEHRGLRIQENHQQDRSLLFAAFLIHVMVLCPKSKSACDMVPTRTKLVGCTTVTIRNDLAPELERDIKRSTKSLFFVLN
jgi:hypothetical protein